MFKLKRITAALKNGQLDDDLVKDYLDYSAGLWIKRLSTEFIMNYVTYVELMSEKASKVSLKEDSEFLTIHHSIIEFANSFDISKTDNETLQEMIGFRKYLTKAMKVLTGYGDYARLLEYMLNRLESDGYDQPTEDEAFVSEVLTYIFSEKDNALINDKVKEVYGQLPIRLSKHKLFSMLEQSIDRIKGVSLSSMNDYISYLRETFYPEAIHGFGELLTICHEELISLGCDIEGPIEKDQLEKKQQALSVVVDHLNSKVTLYLMATGIINLIIGLILTYKSSGDVLEKEHTEQVKNLLTRVSARVDEMNLIDDLVYHQLVKFEGIIEHSASELSILEGVDEQLKTLIKEPYLERLTKQNQCYLLTSGSYFGDLEVANRTGICDNRQIALFKQELCEFIQSVLEKDRKIFQRARIAALLRSMNIVQTTPSEIHEFMLMNFTGCKQPIEKNQSQNMIRILMNDD